MPAQFLMGDSAYVAPIVGSLLATLIRPEDSWCNVRLVGYISACRYRCPLRYNTNMMWVWPSPGSLRMKSCCTGRRHILHGNIRYSSFNRGHIVFAQKYVSPVGKLSKGSPNRWRGNVHGKLCPWPKTRFDPCTKRAILRDFAYWQRAKWEICKECPNRSQRRHAN